MSVQAHQPEYFSPASYRPELADVIPINGNTETLKARTSSAGFEIVDEKQISIGGVSRIVQTATYTNQTGITDELRIVQPAEGARETTDLLGLPGCTESVSRGTFRNLTNAVALRFPGSRVAAIANDGINTYGSKLSARELFSRGFPAIGADRAEAAGAFANGRPLSLFTESMGEVEATFALRANMIHPVVDIEAVVHHCGAGVLPGHAPERMLGAFMPLLTIDAARTAAAHPVQVLKGMAPRPDMLKPRTWTAIGSQVLHLLGGVDYDVMSQVAGGNYQGFIKGAVDPVYDSRMMHKLQTDHPSRVHLWKARGGHAAALDYMGTSKKIAIEFAYLDYLRGND